MSIKDIYAVMEGMEKYVVSGAVPGLRSVVYHEPEKGAFTDGDTIHLPYPHPGMDDTALLLWRYYAEHEMGHEDPVNASPHWKEVMEKHKSKHTPLFWQIANLLSDHVQEHNRIGVMVGRDEVLLKGRMEHSLKDIGAAERAGQFHDNSMSGLFMLDWEERKEWNQHIKDKDKAWRGSYPVAEAFAKLVASKVSLVALKNEQEVYEATKVIYDLLPEEERKAAEEKAAGGKEAIPGKVSDHGAIPVPGAEREKGDKPVGGVISKPEDHKGAFFSRTPLALDEVYRRQYGDIPVEDSGYRGHISGFLKKTNLPAKVRAYLLARKIAKYSTGYRSGKLDTNRLTDVLRGRDDVFRRKESVRMVSTAVYLLVDASGSMYGRPYAQAAAAGIMLAEALQGVKVNIEIAGFTEFGRGTETLVHETACRFGQRFVREKAMQVFCKLASCLNENADGENLLYAYHRIKQQQEERKLIVIISDGQPSAGGHPSNSGSRHDSSHLGFAKKVVKEIEADKGVELWAIGIGDYTPEFYSNHVTLGDTGLESTLLNLVKKTLVR